MNLKAKLATLLMAGTFLVPVAQAATGSVTMNNLKLVAENSNTNNGPKISCRERRERELRRCRRCRERRERELRRCWYREGGRGHGAALPAPMVELK